MLKTVRMTEKFGLFCDRNVDGAMSALCTIVERAAAHRLAGAVVVGVVDRGLAAGEHQAPQASSAVVASGDRRRHGDGGGSAAADSVMEHQDS